MDNSNYSLDSKGRVTVFFKRGQIDREWISGVIIVISLFVILISMVGIQILNVKITNIELIDRGLYSVITDKGPVNIAQDDILRIERTYKKASITGTDVELDKIYTTKGFIYMSSLDPFYKTGSQLINSIDSESKPIWIINNTGSDESFDQRQNTNLELVRPFSYAIGTSSKLASVIFSILSLQYLSLAIGGLALMILIFPLRLETSFHSQVLSLQDPEYRAEDEKLDVLAK